MTDIPRATRKHLKPFGGIIGQKNYEQIREEAIRTLPRQTCFERGYITVKDLDDEELVAGRCRNGNGAIPKAPGKTELIPRHLYDEMVAEHELRYKQKLRENLDRMLDVMVEIANDDTVEPRDRFEAAKYLFERTAGKTPENVTVNVKHAPWEDLLAQVSGIAPMTRDEHRRIQAGIVDAEVVEEYDGQEEENQAEYQSSHPQDDREGYDDAVGADDATMPTVVTPDEPANVNDYWVEGDITHKPPPEPAQEDPERNYGRRADEKRSYIEQMHDAQALAKRRKEAKAKIQNAKKQRKIDRAVGADAIKDEITGATLGDDGKLRFEQG
jgi:hypothetical protein